MHRLRGLSRRGSHSGTRGQPSRPNPEPVEPINVAPPSPRALNLPNAIPMNSQQSARFLFQSSLTRPLVIVTFTISVAEEPTKARSPSPTPPVVNADTNVFLGDMSGTVFPVEHMQEDPPAADPPQQSTERQMQVPDINVVPEAAPPAPAKKASRKKERIRSGQLHLVTHPDGTPVFNEEGMVTWLPPPEPSPVN